MGIHINSLARLSFVLSVVFFSIYFLYSPSKNIDHESSLEKEYYSPIDPKLELQIKRKRQQELKAAIEETRIEINNRLKKFSFRSSIPGSKINTIEDLLKFRKHMECITTRGKWVYDGTPRAVLKHKQEPLYGKCDRNSASLSKNASIEEIWDNSRNSAKYKWKTADECPLPSFTREDYCSLIIGKKILIAGDILSFQLHELLLDYFHDGPVQCYGEIACKDHVLCRPPSSGSKSFPLMRYARNDILSSRKFSILPEDHDHTEVKNVELPWMAYAVHYNVIILNKGHHYQDDATFRSSLIRMVKNFRTEMPKTLLIFKSTTIGHLNCNNPNLEPLFNPYSDYELDKLPYHWSEIHKQNMIAKEIIEAVGGVYWNLENIMEVRVDGHIGGRDCLRWCIPGPSDVWLDLLFVLLKELKL